MVWSAAAPLFMKKLPVIFHGSLEALFVGYRLDLNVWLG